MIVSEHHGKPCFFKAGAFIALDYHSREQYPELFCCPGRAILCSVTRNEDGSSTLDVLCEILGKTLTTVPAAMAVKYGIPRPDWCPLNGGKA